MHCSCTEIYFCFCCSLRISLLWDSSISRFNCWASKIELESLLFLIFSFISIARVHSVALRIEALAVILDFGKHLVTLLTDQLCVICKCFSFKGYLGLFWLQCHSIFLEFELDIGNEVVDKNRIFDENWRSH